MSNCFISPGVSLLPHAANKQLAFAQPELDLEQLLAKEEEMLLKKVCTQACLFCCWRIKCQNLMMIPSPPKLDAVRNVKVLPPIGVTAAPENEASIEEEEEQEDSFEDDEGEIDEEIEVPAALFM